MDKTLYAGLLRSLSAVVLLAHDSQKSQSVANAIAYAATLIDMGAEGENKLKKLAAKIESMVAEGSEPTWEDFEELRLRSNAAHETIQRREGTTKQKHYVTGSTPGPHGNFGTDKQKEDADRKAEMANSNERKIEDTDEVDEDEDEVDKGVDGDDGDDGDKEGERPVDVR